MARTVQNFPLLDIETTFEPNNMWTLEDQGLKFVSTMDRACTVYQKGLRHIKDIADPGWNKFLTWDDAWLKYSLTDIFEDSWFKLVIRYRIFRSPGGWLAEVDILCPWASIWSTWVPNVDQTGAHGHKMSTSVGQVDAPPSKEWVGQLGYKLRSAVDCESRIYEGFLQKVEGAKINTHSKLMPKRLPFDNILLL